MLGGEIRVLRAPFPISLEDGLETDGGGPATIATVQTGTQSGLIDWRLQSASCGSRRGALTEPVAVRCSWVESAVGPGETRASVLLLTGGATLPWDEAACGRVDGGEARAHGLQQQTKYQLGSSLAALEFLPCFRRSGYRGRAAADGCCRFARDADGRSRPCSRSSCVPLPTFQ